jgi:Spy/CpxP family protein refolding chaperone
MPSKTAQIAGDIVELLTPLASEDRHRAVSAALMILGEQAIPLQAAANSNPETTPAGTSGERLPDRAKLWARQNSIDDETLQQVFHILDDGVEVIAAAIPGKSKKEQALNCYLLTGISRLLASGDTSFDDKQARSVCQQFGCYDNTNHSSYLKDKGNELAGNKDRGWSLTSPGLKSGAALVKQIAGAAAKP